MAKKSMIAREAKRARAVAKYAKKRAHVVYYDINQTYYKHHVVYLLFCSDYACEQGYYHVVVSAICQMHPLLHHNYCLGYE